MASFTKPFRIRAATFTVTMSGRIRVLVVNPNSSKSITVALSRVLQQSCPPGIDLTFFNPSKGPAGIKDTETANQSCTACLDELTGPDPRHDLLSFDGALVACFSTHPLINALREVFASGSHHGQVLGIYHAGVSSALLTPGPFGILATGTGEKPNLVAATADFLGSATSSRFAGVLTTGLQVVELQDGDQAKVERGMKQSTKSLIRLGARTIIFGCAGMSGMEKWVRSAAAEQGCTVRIVDGAKTGVHMLAAMIRVS